MVIDSDGRTGFIDAKTIDNDRFQYSLIDRDQIDFLKSVGDICPAGYVVFFRGNVQRVVFFRWMILMSCQPGTSLKPEEGLDLGPLTKFSVRKIFLAKPQVA